MMVFSSGTPSAGDAELEVVGPPDVLVPGSEMLLLRGGVLLAGVGLLALGFVAVARFLRHRRNRPPRRRTAMFVAASAVLIGVVLAVANRPPPFFVPEYPALPRILPSDAFFYRRVDGLPVAERSAQQIAAMGDLPVLGAAGSQVIDGMVGGMPFNLVDDDTPRHRFRFFYELASDDVEYPISDPAYIQSMPYYGIDDHYIGIDFERRRMWEVITIRDWFGVWSGTSGAEWDLDDLRYPRGRTTASGLPILPGLFTWAEVDSGEIPHVITASAPVTRRGEWIWPARGSDGVSDDPEAPPMGVWIRLRSDVDLSTLGPQATVVARALQSYGAVIADTGPNFAVNGTTDARWDDADIASLSQLRLDDFEVVDPSTLMVSAESMEAHAP